MRLFIALPLPAPLRETLSAWTARQSAPGARWTRAEDLHLTLHFLGETPAARRAAAEASLEALRAPAFEAALAGLGAFPDEKRPRVLWAAVARGGEALAALARSLGELLKARDFSVEEKPFRPHVTLARFGAPAARFVAEALLSARGAPWGSFRADRAALYESRPGAAGPRYAVLKEVSLSA